MGGFARGFGAARQSDIGSFSPICWRREEGAVVADKSTAGGGSPTGREFEKGDGSQVARLASATRREMGPRLVLLDVPFSCFGRLEWSWECGS